MEARARHAVRPLTISSAAIKAIAAAGAVMCFLVIGAFILSRGKDEFFPSRDGRSWAAYLEFGLTRDTLWLAPADAPDERRPVFTAQHAPGYGLVAALSPTGREIAFTALPASTDRPAADSPGDL